MSDIIRTRAAAPDELRLVRSSWRRGYFRSDFAGPVTREVWSQVYETIVSSILARPEVIVTVAEKPGELPPDDLWGWVAHERDGEWHSRERVDGYWREVTTRLPVVHFLYVKEGFRGHGVARRLLDDIGVDQRLPYVYTSKTDPVARFFRDHPLSARNAIFAPGYLRRRRKENPDAQAGPFRGIQSSDRSSPEGSD